MKAVPPAATELVEDRRGAVFLEFLIAFLPLWVFFLCVVQLALIARASLMVKNAADSAARSAAVVLPDDPNEYAGEPEMSLARQPFAEDDVFAAMHRLASSDSDESALASLSAKPLANVGRSRLNTIRLAAYVPLAPLAPHGLGFGPRPSIRDAIGDERVLLTALHHQPFALAVTFPGSVGDVASGPEITVRVTYAYQCTVPVARRLLCRSFDELESRGDYERALLPILSRFSGARFYELKREATLLIQDAPYGYRTRGS